MFASSKALNRQKAMNRNASFCGGFVRGLAGTTNGVITTGVVSTAVAVDPCSPYPGDRVLGLQGQQRSTAARTPACA